MLHVTGGYRLRGVDPLQDSSQRSQPSKPWPILMHASIFHPAFKPKPFWWDFYDPTSFPRAEIPGRTRVAIIGAGYAGLACAIELHKHGVDCILLEAEQPGTGASTRNGG